MTIQQVHPSQHPIIDSHCHLNMILEKKIPQEDIFSLMKENKVDGFIQISTDPQSISFAQQQKNKNFTMFYGYTIGHHPNEVTETDYTIGLNKAKEASEDTHFVAVGEIGLDYYYTKEHKKKQIQVFETYLDIASQVGRPVCIHTRNAHNDTLHILKNFTDGSNTLIHCFTGNESQMKDFLEIGCYISFSGIVTFKNAKEIQQAAKACPSDRLLVETDAPFLAPIPFRGKINQPAYVRHTLNFLADLKEISPYNLGKKTYENTKKFYRLDWC